MVSDKYWYFRFTQEFVDDEVIERLENLPMEKGYKLIWIYLKMCSKCIRFDNLVWKVPCVMAGEGYATYIARSIREDSKTVSEALTYFISNGWISVREEEVEAQLHFSELENKVGSSSKAADRKRLMYRQEKEEVKRLESSTALDEQAELKELEERKILTNEERTRRWQLKQKSINSINP